MENIHTSEELLKFLKNKYGDLHVADELDWKSANKENETENRQNLTSKLDTFFHAVHKQIQPDEKMLLIWMIYLKLMVKAAFQSTSVEISLDEKITDPNILSDLKEVRLYFYTLKSLYYKQKLYWENALPFFEKYFPEKLEKFRREALEFVQVREFETKNDILKIVTVSKEEKSADLKVTAKGFKNNSMVLPRPTFYPDTPSSIIESSTSPESGSSSEQKHQKGKEEQFLCSIPFKKTETVTEAINRAISDYEKPVPPAKLAKLNQTGADLDILTLNSTKSKEPEQFIQINSEKYKKHKQIGKGGSSAVYMISPIGCEDTVFACKSIYNISDAKIFSSYLNEIILMLKMIGVQEMVQIYGFEIKSNEENEIGHDFQVKKEVKGEIDTDYQKEVIKYLISQLTSLTSTNIASKTYTIHIIMEQGRSDLATYLKRQKVEPFLLFKKILVILLKLYDLRIVHADLKPANFILMYENGQNTNDFSLKLIDFGISRETPSNTTSIIQDEKVGTIDYISPEKVHCHYNTSLAKEETSVKYNRSSDVWSFGMIIYELIHGHTFFSSLGLTNMLKKLSWLKDGEVSFCSCVEDLEKGSFSTKEVENKKTENFFFDPNYHIISNEHSVCSSSCSLQIPSNDKKFLLSVVKSCLKLDSKERISIHKIQEISDEYEKRRVTVYKEQ